MYILDIDSNNKLKLKKKFNVFLNKEKNEVILISKQTQKLYNFKHSIFIFQKKNLIKLYSFFSYSSKMSFLYFYNLRRLKKTLKNIVLKNFIKKRIYLKKNIFKTTYLSYFVNKYIIKKWVKKKKNIVFSYIKEFKKITNKIKSNFSFKKLKGLISKIWTKNKKIVKNSYIKVKKNKYKKKK